MLCSIFLLVLHEPWNMAMTPAGKINITNCIAFFYLGWATQLAGKCRLGLELTANMLLSNLCYLAK